jgi:hypothetical protein
MQSGRVFTLFLDRCDGSAARSSASDWMLPSKMIPMNSRIVLWRNYNHDNNEFVEWSVLHHKE